MEKIRKAVCLVLCVVLVWGSALGVCAAPEITKAYPQGIYVSAVRDQPYNSAAVIGQLENGTLLTVLAESGDYYRIDCYDMTGYIAKQQVAQRENGEYYVNCSGESEQTSVMPHAPREEVAALQAAVLELTQAQLGDPYVYGGSSPGGFDCSGLVWYVYGRQEYTLGRGCSAQMGGGLIVDKDAMEVGDLVFFREVGSPYLASHVGIYVGDGQIIHAGSRGIGYADLAGAWFSDYFLCARRILNEDSMA